MKRSLKIGLSESTITRIGVIAVAVIILTALALSQYFNRLSPLGELLEFELENTSGCSLEFNFDNSHVLDSTQSQDLLEFVAAIPARYSGPEESERGQNRPDSFDLFLTSRDYGIAMLIFYADGTVVSRAGQSLSYTIDSADYEALRQFVDDLIRVTA